MRFQSAALICALASGLLFAPVIGSAAWAQAASQPPGTTVVDNSNAAASPLDGLEQEIAAGHYDKARGLLDAYLSAHPKDARGLFDRGYCDDAQGKTAQAEGWYRKAIAADPKQFESRLALGLILAKQGDAAGAKEQLQAASGLEPNPPNPAAKAQALRALARLTRNSDPEAAKQALIGALRISPETPADTLLAAQIAEAAGDDAIAEQAYRRALKASPESPEAIAGLAHVLVREKKAAEAGPLLKSALTRDPDDPGLNAEYAAVLGAEGHEADAVPVLEKLHQLEPGNSAVAKMLADSYEQTGEEQKADGLYAELLAKSRNDIENGAELESARGQVLIREGKYAEALILLQNAVKVRQDDADAWSGIAFAAAKEHKPELTLQALGERAKFAAETPATYFLWATANDNLHRSKQALEYYQIFLKSAGGKFPDEEWQARQRILALSKK